MAKKVLMIFLSVMLIASLTLVSCNQDAGGKVTPGPDAPDDPDTPDVPVTDVVDVLGIIGKNVVYNGAFDDGTDSDIQADGATAPVEAGIGIGGSGAMHVKQSASYGSVFVDFTSIYARGRSYYVEASFKDSGAGTRDDDPTAYISFTVCSGAVMDTAAAAKAQGIDGDDGGAYYAYDDIYGGDLSENDGTFGTEIKTINTSGADLDEDKDESGWVTVSGILPASVVDTMLIEQTKKYGSGDPTVQYLFATFLVGTYPRQDGYDYYLDNVIIKTLNDDIPAEGRTYKPEGGDDPEPEDPDEDEDIDL